MKIWASLNDTSKILATLTLPLFAGISSNACAGDIPATDPTAPCGILSQMGEIRKIYNNSNFFFSVRFETKVFIIGPFQSVNAGAVKYLDEGEGSYGIWHDTGVGDYRSIKKYTIPIKPNHEVKIAYCADSSNGFSIVKGTVYFEADPSDGDHHAPQGGVGFNIKTGRSRDITRVVFNTHQPTPFVSYSRSSSGKVEDGSLTICPKDSYCKLE